MELVFPSRTGFPGHSDEEEIRVTTLETVEQCFHPERASQAIPTAGHSQMSGMRRRCFNPERASQAIPTVKYILQEAKLIRLFPSRTAFPGHSDATRQGRAHSGNEVSIPNGLPRPFRLGFWWSPTIKRCLFPSRTGFPGHSDISGRACHGPGTAVSIPNGLPRPFRR